MRGPVSITTTSGRKFHVRLIEKGDAYGLDDCLRHEEDDPLVEFWDATCADSGGFGPLGQFVARYFASALRGRRPQDLCLDAGVPAWTLDPAALQAGLVGVGVLPPAPPARVALVGEWHYTDGDVGAYADTDIIPLEAEAMRLLWAAFAPPRDGHRPARLVIRPATPNQKES